jgi:predicted kinase
MIGVSGSGKTTWVNSHKNYVVCSTDSILEQLATTMGVSYTEAFDYIQRTKKFDYITEKFFEKIHECIIQNNDFVIDRTHLKRHIRISLVNELKSFAVEHGRDLELIAISFEISPKIIFERLKQREKKPWKVIPKNVILEQINSFDIPAIDEGFTSIERIT